MPNETYQPKKIRRSGRGRSRIIRRLYTLVGLIVIFYIITASLDRFDETPKWARVWFPPFAVKNESYNVNVSYRGRSPSADVRAIGVITGENGLYFGDLEAKQEVSSGRERGRFFFGFTVPTDSNAVSIQFLVDSNEVMSNPNTEPRPAIKSGDIRILPSDHERVTRSYDLPEWQNVIMTAFEDGNWADKRGDPTVVGWGITLCYAMVGVLCLYCTGMLDSRRVVPISQIGAWFWRLMAVVLIFVAINKQLDLQLLLADIGNTFAKYQGWHAQKRPVEIRVLALGTCVCMAFLLEVRHKLKGAPRSILAALLGVIILGVNVFMSLVSLPSIEGVLAFSVAGLSVSSGIEILAIFWISASALIYNTTQREEVSYIMQ